MQRIQHEHTHTYTHRDSHTHTCALACARAHTHTHTHTHTCMSHTSGQWDWKKVFKKEKGFQWRFQRADKRQNGGQKHIIQICIQGLAGWVTNKMLTLLESEPTCKLLGRGPAAPGLWAGSGPSSALWCPLPDGQTNTNVQRPVWCTSYVLPSTKNPKKVKQSAQSQTSSVISSDSITELSVSPVHCCNFPQPSLAQDISSLHWEEQDLCSS